MAPSRPEFLKENCRFLALLPFLIFEKYVIDGLANQSPNLIDLDWAGSPVRGGLVSHEASDGKGLSDSGSSHVAGIGGARRR